LSLIDGPEDPIENDPRIYGDEPDTAPRSDDDDDDDDEEDAQRPEEDPQHPEPEDIVPNKMSTIKPCDD
jgi:hypothetical protein